MDRRIFLGFLGAAGLAPAADADTLKSLIDKAVNANSGLSGKDADGGVREALTDGTLSAVRQVSKPMATGAIL